MVLRVCMYVQFNDYKWDSNFTGQFIGMASQKHIWPLTPCRGRFRAVGEERRRVLPSSRAFVTLRLLSLQLLSVALGLSGPQGSGWMRGGEVSRGGGVRGIRQVPVYSRPQGAGGVTQDNIEQCFKTLDVKCHNYLSIGYLPKIYFFHELHTRWTKLLTLCFFHTGTYLISKCL